MGDLEEFLTGPSTLDDNDGLRLHAFSQSPRLFALCVLDPEVGEKVAKNLVGVHIEPCAPPRRGFIHVRDLVLDVFGAAVRVLAFGNFHFAPVISDLLAGRTDGSVKTLAEFLTQLVDWF